MVETVTRLLRIAHDEEKGVRSDKKRNESSYFFSLLLILAFVSLSGGIAAAADAPFVGAANWGGTGLMELPNARVLEEGHFRIGASQADPYRTYYFAIAPFRGLEVGGRVTENLDVDISSAPGWGGYGNNKDKAIDLKYRLLPEGKWWPAVAIGLMDPHGTRVYPAQYIVASKQFYPFDFTVGFGNGRFGRRPLPAQGEGFALEIITDNGSWRRDGQFFGGVEFAATPNLSLIAEYSPIRYHETGDPSQRSGGSFNEPVPSKVNVGLRWRPWRWFEADLSWQRGNQIGLNLSASFDLGSPMIPLFDQPYRESPEMRSGTLEERIARGLAESGFRDIVIDRGGGRLSIQARNDRYYYAPRALGAMLRIAYGIAPPEIGEFRLILAENGIPVVAFTTSREDAALFLTDKLTPAQFLQINRDRYLFSENRDRYHFSSGSGGDGKTNGSRNLFSSSGDSLPAEAGSCSDSTCSPINGSRYQFSENRDRYHFSSESGGDGATAAGGDAPGKRRDIPGTGPGGVTEFAETTRGPSPGMTADSATPSAGAERGVSAGTRADRDRSPFDLTISEGLPGKTLYRQWWDYGLKPSVQLFLNDPSGFLKYRAGGRGWVSILPWPGGTFVGGLEFYPLNSISSSNTPLSNPVRSDLVPYQQSKEVLGMLLLEQVAKFPSQIHGRVAAGILEAQYAGIDAEVARPLFGGRLMMGLSGSVVKKRDPDRLLGLKENDPQGRYETAFVNTRINLPEVEAAVDLKVGQFLAGDRGTRITVSKFFNSLVLSAWYSVTDTDHFTDSFNRGYHDKGISISIPLRFFTGKESRTTYQFGLSPWTRDVAQDIDHFTTLFDSIGRNTELHLQKDAASRGRNASLQ